MSSEVPDPPPVLHILPAELFEVGHLHIDRNEDRRRLSLFREYIDGFNDNGLNDDRSHNGGGGADRRLCPRYADGRVADGRMVIDNDIGCLKAGACPMGGST